MIRETLDKPSYSIMEKPELGSDHLSDDSSKGRIIGIFLFEKEN